MEVSTRHCAVQDGLIFVSLREGTIPAKAEHHTNKISWGNISNLDLIYVNLWLQSAHRDIPEVPY